MKTKCIVLLIFGAAWVLVSLPTAADGYSTDFKTCPTVPCTFADMYLLVYNNQILRELVGEDGVYLLNLLHPSIADVNGPSYIDKSGDPNVISINGNGMLDCYAELDLVGYFLKNPGFSVNGITGAMVRDIYNQNRAQLGLDLDSFGTEWVDLFSLLPGLRQMLIGNIIVGDGDAVFSLPATPGGDDYQRIDWVGSWGFVEAMFAGVLGSSFMGANAFIDPNLYHRMPEYFSKDGDCDGDGVSNGCESAAYSPGDTYPNYSSNGSSLTTYVTNARDPNVFRADCVDECSTMTGLFNTEWPLMAADLGLSDNVAAAPNNNIPERWGLALIRVVMCNVNHPHHDAVMAAYAENVASLEAESPEIVARITPYKHVLAAILLINQSRTDYFIDLLGLDNFYAIVHGPQKDLNEPFSDEGDLDGDGITNYEEYLNVLARGGSYNDYANYANNPLQGGTVPLAAWPMALALLVAGLAALPRRGRRPRAS